MPQSTDICHIPPRAVLSFKNLEMLPFPQIPKYSKMPSGLNGQRYAETQRICTRNAGN